MTCEGTTWGSVSGIDREPSQHLAGIVITGCWGG